MLEKVNQQGQVIETKDIDGVVGTMPTLTTDISNAQVDFAGYLYKEKMLNGVTGRMPVVSLEGGSSGGGGIAPSLENNTGILYVNNAYAGEVEDGSSQHPYKTINAAYEAAEFGNVILVAYGTGSYYDDIKIYKEGLTIIGLTQGKYKVPITAGYIHVYAKNTVISGFSFESNSYGDDSLGIFSGDVTISGCRGGGLEVGSIPYDGIVVIEDCSIDKINLSGNYEETIVNLLRCGADEFTTTVNITGSGGIINIRSCYGLFLSHYNSLVNIYDSQLEHIRSYATATSKMALLNLYSGSIYRNGSLGIVEKFEDCDYWIGNFVFDYENSTLNGARQDNDGLNSIQLYDKNTRAGYTTAGSTLKDHLDGISSKLVELESRLNALSS